MGRRSVTYGRRRASRWSPGYQSMELMGPIKIVARCVCVAISAQNLHQEVPLTAGEIVDATNGRLYHDGAFYFTEVGGERYYMFLPDIMIFVCGSTRYGR